ncbi:hypothetical protein [Haloactinopolyspora alba]|uniref:hypothetical protein n=1 Tax=Haloactinopolyspora alba TaxID=648780 RepID=UPI0013ECCDF0|nr:hypothetical protein [Haloactinopolyspora alba]
MDVERYEALGTLGVAVVVDQAAGVVMIDAALSHDEAVDAIQHVMPDVPPDAVEHWVERQLPTAEPLAQWLPLEMGASLGGPSTSVPPVLSTRLNLPSAFVSSPAPPPTPAPPVPPAVPAKAPTPPPNRAARRARSRRHARPSRSRRWVGRVATATGATSIGAVAAAVILAPTGAVADAWDDPIFSRVATEAELVCTPLEGEPLRAQCTDARGHVADAEATVGPDSITYAFSGGVDRTVLKVFSSARAMRRWAASLVEPASYPNLATGDRVALYGSEPAMFAPVEGMFNEQITAEKVAPVVLRTSYAMGMLPDSLALAAKEADPSLDIGGSVKPAPEVQAHAATVLAGSEELGSSDPGLPDEVSVPVPEDPRTPPATPEVSTDPPVAAPPAVPDTEGSPDQDESVSDTEDGEGSAGEAETDEPVEYVLTDPIVPSLPTVPTDPPPPPPPPPEEDQPVSEPPPEDPPVDEEPPPEEDPETEPDAPDEGAPDAETPEEDAPSDDDPPKDDGEGEDTGQKPPDDELPPEEDPGEEDPGEDEHPGKPDPDTEPPVDDDDEEEEQPDRPDPDGEEPGEEESGDPDTTPPPFDEDEHPGQGDPDTPPPHEDGLLDDEHPGQGKPDDPPRPPDTPGTTGTPLYDSVANVMEPLLDVA